jgi:hypothetical protein
MLYAVATLADTSSNQAIKDTGQRRCGYSNLGKIVIKSVAAKHVAAFVATRGGSCLKIPLPDILRAEQKVACAKQSLFQRLWMPSQPSRPVPLIPPTALRRITC